MANPSNVSEAPMLPSDNFLGVVGRFQKNPIEVFEQMEAKNEPLVQFRLAHKTPYYVAGFEVLQELMRQWKLYQKSQSNMTQTLLGNGLVFAEGEEWSAQRRIMSPAFHRRAIQGYIQIMRGRALSKVEELKQKSAKGIASNMGDTFHEIAIQIVRDCLFGTHNDQSELDVVLEGTLYMLNHTVKVRKNPLMPGLWAPTPANRKALRYHKAIERVVLNAIEEKRTSTDKSTTMLEMMFWGRDSESEFTLSYQNIIDQVKIFFVAGTDTSANTLTWAFYLLGKHPDVLAEVYEELDEVLGGEPITLDTLPQLRKLRNVIYETLRLYPATWINARKPTEDVVLGGYHIPANSSLVFSPYMMLRKAEFWANPHSFQPDRFDKVNELPPHYIPFLAGPRKCIGDQFAMTEMQVVLGTLLQHFTWRLPDNFEAEMGFGSTLGVKNAMLAQLSIRPSVA
ncbi:MAG: cytochrome P450 [Bacteroidota bacterium]